MSKESREERIERVRKLLGDGEAYAFEYFLKVNQPALAPSLNAQLYTLFLNGRTTEEIRRINPAITLGQIVHARIEGDWDLRREEYLDRLLTETTGRVQQATLETADFVCDMLAVANKEHGDRLRKYLQTGNQDDLGDFKIDSIFNLKQTIEALQKLTGQDRQIRVLPAGMGKDQDLPVDQPVLSVSRAPTADEAANTLKNLKALLPPKSNN